VDETFRDGAVRVKSRRGLRAPERLLVESLPARSPGLVLSGLDTEGAVALAARTIWESAAGLTTLHLDAYVAAKVKGVLSRNRASDVTVLCAPDLPGVSLPGEPVAPAAPPLDLVALPFPKGGEALFGREILEEAHAALRPGGRLLAATDDPKGTWLKKVVKEIFGKATVVRKEKRGICVGAARTRPRAEVRDHRHPMKMAVGERELAIESRPGVFGHARLDGGTRALAARLDPKPGDRVLDLGCGYGALGLAAAALAPLKEAVLVDSNARAVLLAARNAAANGFTNVRVLLRADLEDLGSEPFDLALANPPYFSNFRIAAAFVTRAHALLRMGGRLLLVAKASAEHAAIVREHFGAAAVEEAPGGYGIVRAVKVK
jgi:16S rRNA (guanine1207-N2)-methyltransferase